MENTPKSKRRQSNSNRQRKDGQERSTPIAVTPLLVENGLYSVEQVLAALATSERSLEKMLADGLRSGKRHTQRRFFWGRDVIRFLVEGPTDGAE